MPERFSYDGLAPIEERVSELALDAAYIVMHDRTERTSDEPVGRFDLDEADLGGPFLDDAPEREDDEDGDDDAPEPEEEDEEARKERLRERLAERACAWIRETAERNTVGEAKRRFRVKVYGPKGHSVLYSGQFVCINDYEDEAATSLPQLPAVTPMDPVQLATDRGWRALGDGYAQYSHLVIGGVAQIQGVNNGLLARLSKQNADLQMQNEKLVAHILQIQFQQSEASAERSSKTENETRRAELIKSGLEQLGSITNALLLQRGLPPDLADLLGAIAAHPKLMDTIKDQRVKVLLKDPNNLDMLAKLLNDAAKQQAAIEAASTEPTPNPA